MLWMKYPGRALWRLLSIVLFIMLSYPDPSVLARGKVIKTIEWQFLTKQNFSSQIRLHSYILLMVTVPWSGESKSLMQKTASAVSRMEEKFGSLRLMLLYRNNDNMLAEAIGATDEITILFYHHSVSYKYHGQFQVRNILSSAHYLISLSPEEVPVRSISTTEDLENFLDSTDMTILLLEFCGWTTKLLTKTNNETENAFNLTGGLFGAISSEETNPTSTLKENKYQERIVDETFRRDVNNEADENLLQDYSLIKDTPDGLSCTLEEFQHFNSFLPNFMNTAKEFFLPAERRKFGLISDRFLLSTLGIRDSRSWLAILYYTGCPSCTKILKEGDDLKDALQMHKSLVIEVEGDGDDLKPPLPANMPALLLFIDRSSELSIVRRKSKEALDVFRNFVLDSQNIYETALKMNDISDEKSSIQDFKVSEVGYPPSEVWKKSSISKINEGVHVGLDHKASDLQDSKLSVAFTYSHKHQKEARFSSVASQLGFQLLSDDFNIKIADILPSQSENAQSNQGLLELPSESHIRNNDLDNERFPSVASVSSLNHKEHIIDENMEIDQLRKQFHHPNVFEGSYFFSDGGYRLLNALTASEKIPSLVIVDPKSQQHYVFPKHTLFSHSSLVDFVNRFLNGTLSAYQQSGSLIASPREVTHPPFVNLDFHELNGIPRVTAFTFSETVLGSNQIASNYVENAWKKDVLVLFSNSWCGFCYRMEVVVREVYQALKGFINMQKAAAGNGCCLLESGMTDCLEEITFKLPLIYLMDCTLNDCSLILRSIGQTEHYPSLLLFPAERKNAIAYEGDISVVSIMKFIADHGHNSHLITGLLTAESEKGGFYEKPSFPFDAGSPNAKDSYYKVILRDRTPRKAVKYMAIISYTSKGSGLDSPASPHIVPGSILLATEKLLGAALFEQSKVLIVKVDQNSGFQGLIINKHSSWENLEGPGKELKEALKDAALSIGGPLIMQGMPLQSLCRGCMSNEVPEVVPGVYFLDQSATRIEIERLKSGNESSMNHWFFLGYASWAWDQLLAEISDGAWNVSTETVGDFEWP